MKHQYLPYILNLTSDTFVKMGQIGKAVPNWELFISVEQEFLILSVTKTLYSKTLYLVFLLMDITNKLEFDGHLL